MNRPAPVEITYESMRFLITHNPTNATLNKFTEELKKYGVTTLVRVCDSTYDTAPVEKEGIQVVVSSLLTCIHSRSSFVDLAPIPFTSVLV
ncbi:Protein tyrosine phosphatase type IVA 2 [Acipenser ruthenus]|uniref:Protein tyrosine phosphatase type IVA 2 n=1 Tax=Acipenser ruthenus TaxID=7906 RepID=A0A444URV9_ACIRT|nr:Protein tyrosine phosphatase type IVA 2 [Acipenser ruthenus]